MIFPDTLQAYPNYPVIHEPFTRRWYPLGMVKRQEIREHLNQLLASEQFVSSRSVAKLLTYCVDAALAGDEETLKETTIGVYCFGRTPGYDTKQDPIVRVTARRLRSKLELFYHKDAENHTVRVVLPKGTYVPKFEHRSHSVAAIALTAVPEPVPSTPGAVDAEHASAQALPPEEKLPPIARAPWVTPAAWSFFALALLVSAAAVLPRSHFFPGASDRSQLFKPAAGDASTDSRAMQTGEGISTKTPNQDELFSLTAPKAERDPGSGYADPFVARKDEIAASVEPRL